MQSINHSDYDSYKHADDDEPIILTGYVHNCSGPALNRDLIMKGHGFWA